MSHALKTDLYQLTMMQAYFSAGHNPPALFDYFVRTVPFGSYLVVAGLPDVLAYIEGLRFEPDDIDYLRGQNIFTPTFLRYLESFRFTGTIHGMREGELAFPHEPILRVEAPIMEAQLVETFILNKMNFSSLIATKASRVVYAADGRPVIEFGLRRAQGDAGLEATRASFIGGCTATSHVSAGKTLGIPISGTMAHSFVTSFSSELEAFRVYARTFPKNTTLLIDTYDSLEGAKKAVIVAKELEARGHRLKAVRLDSGDFFNLSREVRRILDGAGLTYVKIFASSDLNEWKIKELLDDGAPIDAFGVGTEMVTAKPDPALGGVYKLAEIAGEPRMKFSDEPGKATLPGRKTVWRLATHEGVMQKDIIALDGEDPRLQGIRCMLAPLVQNGSVIYRSPTLSELQEMVRENLSRLPDAYRALDDAPAYPVEISPALHKLTDNVSRSLKTKS